MVSYKQPVLTAPETLRYEEQLQETLQLVEDLVIKTHAWKMLAQSHILVVLGTAQAVTCTF